MPVQPKTPPDQLTGRADFTYLKDLKDLHGSKGTGFHTSATPAPRSPTQEIVPIKSLNPALQLDWA